MNQNLKEKYGHLKRLATDKETQEVFKATAQIIWDDAVKYANSLGAEIVAKGFDLHLQEQIQRLESTYGGMILVDDFTKIEAQIFHLSLIDDYPQKEKVVNLSDYKYLKYQGVIQDITDADYVDFLYHQDNIITQKVDRLVGRPKQPSEKSILATHKISRMLANDPFIGINQACEIAGIAKSTYYRVARWIVKNTAHGNLPS